MKSVFLIAGFVTSYMIVLAASAEDIQYMRVRMKKCMGFIIANLFLSFCMDCTALYSLAGLIPVMILLAVNFLKGGVVGSADLYLVTGVGVVLGFWGTMLVLLVSLTIGSIWGIVLLKRHPEYEICELPFVPLLGFFYIVWTLPILFSTFGL